VSEEELLSICKALSHPLRLKIVKLLEGGTLRKRDLTRLLGFSRSDTPKLEHHLEKLMKAGLVGVYKTEKATYVYLLKKVEVRAEKLPQPAFSIPTTEGQLDKWLVIVKKQVEMGKLPREIALENIRFLKRVLTRKALL